MLNVLACAALLLGRPAFGARAQEQTRLRTILHNGSVVFVERERSANKLVLQLFVSSRSFPENSKTNGLRHLLEHLSAKGRDRGVDQKLESQGAFLTAQTLRDATVYEITLRPNDLALGLDSLRSVMQLGPLTGEDVAKETAIIRQEMLLEPVSQTLSSAAWQTAYGEEGSDPMGDPDAMAIASPETLNQLHQKLFVGSNLSLVISGDVDLDEATAAAKDLLDAVPNESEPVRNPRTFIKGGITSAAANGEALACTVDNWSSPRTSARLAAALSIASGLKNAFVTYTPSVFGSLIIVGRTGETSGLDRYVSTLSAPGEFGIGRALAKAWVEKERAIQDKNILTGLLLSEGAGQRADTAIDNLDQMTVEQFTSALDSFRSKDTITVLGK